MAAIVGAILDFIENAKLSKSVKNYVFDAGHEEYVIIKHFAAFCCHFLHFSPKKERIKTPILLQKWLDQLLVITSHFVTIATDSNQTCVKMYLRECTQLLKPAGLDDNSSWKNARKTLRRGWHPPPPSLLYARGLTRILIY